MKLSERVRYAYELLESRSQNKINMLDVEEVAQLEEELDVTDKLLEERNRLLSAIPECPEHGAQCVPHGIEYVAKLEAVSLAAREHEDAEWQFDPEYVLDGLRTWGAVLKALKEL